MMRSGVLVLAAVLACLVVQARADGAEVKVCCIGEESYYYCQQMIEAFFGAEPESSDGDGGGGDDDGRRKLLEGHITWSCVLKGQGDNPTSDDDGRRKLMAKGSVMEMIENGECNFGMDMDAHDVYDANKDWGWQAIAGEDYGAGEGLTYFGIAVVPSSVCDANPNVSLTDFKGMRSCHTGYKRTSGWTIPLATILTMEKEEMGEEAFATMLDGKEDYDLMADYFPEQCTAGAPEEKKDVMCKNCIGDCERGDGEPYMGYKGSLRCLMEGAGDIGFMKQSTPLDYAADGNDPQDWSTMAMSDLKLVCPDGGCMEPKDYKQCNYARIPSHMIALSGDLPVDEIRKQFNEAAATEAFADWLSNAKESALFNSRSQGVVPIEQDTVEYMGKLVDVYAILEDLGFY